MDDVRTPHRSNTSQVTSRWVEVSARDRLHLLRQRPLSRVAPCLNVLRVSGMAHFESACSGRKRWPMAITLVVAMSLPFLLPPKFSAGPVWIVPVMEALLLVALVIADPGSHRSPLVLCSHAIDRVGRHPGCRGYGGDPLDWLSISSGAGPRRTRRGQLLRVGSLTWVVADHHVFVPLYWELDGGGPRDSRRAAPEFPDLAFPEHLNPHVTRPGWRPRVLRLSVFGLHQRHSVQSN